MTKKIYTEPSINAALFEAENVITTSSYETAEAAITGGAFTIDNNHSSAEVKAVFTF